MSKLDLTERERWLMEMAWDAAHVDADGCIGAYPHMDAWLDTDASYGLSTEMVLAEDAPNDDALHARIAELEAERDALLLQAQIHAQEARTANATIAECYQACTGATGEPGTWHGAEPVRRVVAERDRCRAALEKIDDWSRAYPLDVFPEPDLKEAARILKAHGMTLDAISASALRHGMGGAGRIVREALEGESDE